jgi:monofunctional biosynthetic peptidoglycan transglycosylase
MGRLKKPFVIVLIGLAAGWVTFSLIQFWIGQAIRAHFPDVAVLKNSYPVAVSEKSRRKRPVYRLQKAMPATWVSLSNISGTAVGAVLVSEDWGFFEHKGYDPRQIREAIQEDIAKGAFARGASTITQQVAKNVFLSQDKTLWRKIREIFLAVEMEKVLGKKRILEIYLNIAEWGDGIFGMEQAARSYFDKPASQLKPREGAFLAMLLPSPIRYSQSFRHKSLTPFARKRIAEILSKMVLAGYLNQEDADRERSLRLSFEVSTGNDESLESASENFDDEVDQPEGSASD